MSGSWRARTDVFEFEGIYSRVRRDCPEPDPDPVGTGIKISTFNGIGTVNPVKTGVETMESRGITLLDSKSR